MTEYEIINLSRRPDLADSAARWFHDKWGIAEEAYRESIRESLKSAAVPQWYVIADGEKLIAGAGVIENDFHDRPELSPNVCGVYVEPEYRKKGIAGRLLGCICADMADRGVKTLYLLTDHTSFYERYGWKFYCMAMGDGEE